MMPCRCKRIEQLAPTRPAKVTYDHGTVLYIRYCEHRPDLHQNTCIGLTTDTLTNCIFELGTHKANEITRQQLRAKTQFRDSSKSMSLPIYGCAFYNDFQRFL